MPYANATLIGWLVIVAGVLLLIALPIALYVRTYRSTVAVLSRARRRSERYGGTASRLEYHRVASKASVRRRVGTLRPDFAKLPVHKRFRVPVTQYATKVATERRLGAIWSSCEDVTVRLGGPRMGKSAELACHVVDAPGACLVTSTRPDLALVTMASRGKVGPLHVFDPAGTSGLTSTIKWSVLAGCRNPRTAQRRARDMIPNGATAEHEKWNSMARRTLAVLLHAAALSDRTMVDVLTWAARPKAPRVKSQVEEALERSPSTNLKAWTEMSDQFFANNDRTQTSITTTLVSYLEWMLDDKASGAGLAADAEMFSVEEMLATRATVYMIGHNSDQVAPLVAALTGEIAYQARTLAKANGGRLDPPLTMVLDEAAIICPVPLDDWTADMGGFNITLHISAQDPAQLREVWGDNGASSILSHAGTLLVFGGIQEMPFLEDCSKKAGDRTVVVASKDGRGKVVGATTRRERVISPDQIMKLEKHQVMVIRSGLSACLAVAPSVWRRRDVRKANAASPYRPVLETAYAEQLVDDDQAEEASA
jgi:type IV secretory pathway TraG/TraD family ATPase VirD4